MIDAPGLYAVEESRYHADTELAPHLGRSLSSSGAKTLLRSPARFHHEREHGRPPKDAFDLGTVIHALTLRGGDNRLRVADAYDWRTKAAQAMKAEAHAAGLVPTHRKQFAEASRVAQAVRRHPLAGAILSVGRPEVSAYAVDPDTGITLRARFDWLRHGTVRDCIGDLKTVGRYGGADPDGFGRQAASLDYPMQAWHYRYVFWLLTGDWLPFYTIAVEVDAPHFVTVGEYSQDDLDAGEARCRAAYAEFAERESSGNWVDEPTVVTFPIPAWYARSAS